MFHHGNSHIFSNVKGTYIVLFICILLSYYINASSSDIYMEIFKGTHNTEEKKIPYKTDHLTNAMKQNINYY